MGSKLRYVIDGRDHMLEPSASAVEESVGKCKVRVVLLRCERICVSGDLDFLKIKYSSFRGLTPSKFIWEIIRGLIGDEREKGKEALARLEVYEGLPPPYNNIRIYDEVNFKRFRARCASRDHNRRDKYCMLGTLCSELVGRPWDNAIRELKKKRRERCIEMKKQLRRLVRQDDDKEEEVVNTDTGALTSQLISFQLEESSSLMEP